MGVAAAPAEPAARLQVVVQHIEILDDREGWLSGKGEMNLNIGIWRCKDSILPPCLHQHVGLSSMRKEFAARTGDIVTLDRVLPGEDIYNNAGEGVTPELGFPVLPGEHYVMSFTMWESDGGFSDSEDMGEVFHHLSTGDHGLGLGTHIGRATGADGGHIGDFIVTYEIRRAPLPDLRPVNIKVHDLPDTARKRVCMAVQNVEIGNPGPHQVALYVDAVVPPGGWTIATGPAPGASHEVCVEAVLPTTGQHALAAVVDAPHALAEYNETNNVHVQLYQAPGPVALATAAPTPSPAQPDLAVSAVKVNDRVPDGKDDCKDGKNTVTVTVKNAGTARAGRFDVRLVVDDDQDDAKEKTVDGLDAGKGLELTFASVRLKEGERTLTSVADAKEVVAESNEGNNTLTVTARCSDDE